MRSLLQGLRVFEAVAERQPVGVSELARALELPKATVQRSLVALGEAGWLRRTAEGSPRWVVTRHAMAVGLLGSGGAALRTVALPVMEELRSAVRETVHLAVPEEDGLVIVERLEGPSGDRRVEPIGQRIPYHATATGKAVLARLSADVRQARLRASLERHGTRTAFQPTALERDLDEADRAGFAVAEREWRAGVTAVGVALLAVSGEPLGALSVSGPADRLSGRARQRAAALVLAAAAELSARLRERIADGGRRDRAGAGDLSAAR